MTVYLTWYVITIPGVTRVGSVAAGMLYSVRGILRQ